MAAKLAAMMPLVKRAPPGADAHRVASLNFQAGRTARDASRHGHLWRWGLLVLVTVPVVLGLIAWRSDGGAAVAVDSRGIRLPDTFMGQGRMTGPLAIDTKQDWLEYAHQQLGAVGYSGMSYGSSRTAIMNVVAARTDLTGKLDLRMVADQGREVGSVRCTQTLSFVIGDTRYPPTFEPNRLLCWRTTKTLSVYVSALGVPPDMGDLASAMGSVWDGIPQ